MPQFPDENYVHSQVMHSTEHCNTARVIHEQSAQLKELQPEQLFYFHPHHTGTVLS